MEVMDEDFDVDLDEVYENVDTAEAMSVFFPTLRKALVLDLRSNETAGPMVRIMPMAASPQERMRSIRRLRPGFPRLERLTVVPWNRYVDSLVVLGVWDRIVKRCEESRHAESVSACEAALEDLKALEKAELAAVVSGENYHTIWSARR